MSNTEFVVKGGFDDSTTERLENNAAAITGVFLECFALLAALFELRLASLPT